MEGVLIAGPDAEKLPPNQSLTATLQDIGACRLRIAEHAKAGARALFQAPDAQLTEKIEDKLWSIREENTEFVTRAMEAGTALTRIFEDAVASGAISIDDMFDTDYVEIPGTNPLQHRTRILDWADRALPPFQEAFLAKDPRMVFCVMIDRNGYLPVHNKVYSHPQRPGDVAWNTANSRNRRIFNDPAGLAAGRNLRSLPDPELCPRHGQRQDRHDARDRRADPRQGAALGRLPHRIQAMNAKPANLETAASSRRPASGWSISSPTESAASGSSSPTSPAMCRKWRSASPANPSGSDICRRPPRRWSPPTTISPTRRRRCKRPPPRPSVKSPNRAPRSTPRSGISPN